MEYIEYREIRDKYWRRYYPSSKTLYNILRFITILFIILNILLFLASVIAIGSNSFLSGLFGWWLLIGFVSALIQIFIFSFIKEMILFQVDKNFYNYTLCSKDLKKIVDDEKNK